MQEEFRGFRRFTAAERKIGEIMPEDGRISFIGTIIDKGEGKLVVDDGSGSVEVVADSELLKSLETGKIVRVVGKVYDGSVTGEAVQDFSTFNLELYREVKSLVDGNGN